MSRRLRASLTPRDVRGKVKNGSNASKTRTSLVVATNNARSRTQLTKHSAPAGPQACAEVESILQSHPTWGGAQGKDFVMTAGRALPYLDGRQPHGFGSRCLGRAGFKNIWKFSCAAFAFGARSAVALECPPPASMRTMLFLMLLPPYCALVQSLSMSERHQVALLPVFCHVCSAARCFESPEAESRLPHAGWRQTGRRKASGYPTRQGLRHPCTRLPVFFLSFCSSLHEL